MLDVLVDLELDHAAGEGHRLVVDVDPRLARLGEAPGNASSSRITGSSPILVQLT